MTILREEYGHHAWLASDIAVSCQIWNLGDILLDIVLCLRQSVTLGVAKGFCIRKRYLDVYHFVMSLNDCLCRSTAFSQLDVNKEVFANNLMLTCLQRVKVILLKKFYYFREQRVHRCIVF